MNEAPPTTISYINERAPNNHKIHKRTSIDGFESLIQPILLYTSNFWGTLRLPILSICTHKVENEIHFLVECKGFTNNRNGLFTAVSREIRNFSSLKKTEKFISLMSNDSITHLTEKYISGTLCIRECLLENHKNNM